MSSVKNTSKNSVSQGSGTFSQNFSSCNRTNVMHVTSVVVFIIDIKMHQKQVWFSCSTYSTSNIINFEDQNCPSHTAL